MQTKRRIASAVESFVYSRASRVVVLSQAFGRLVTSSYGIPEDIIRVVPGGVDVDRYCLSISKQEARVRCKIPLDRPIILCIRRLVQRMGLELLINAMEHVCRRSPDALLIIGGMGPLREQLSAQIELKGLSKNVSLIGFIDEQVLPQFYRAADFTVVPSTSLEGFGLITVESLAAGTPVLVTPVGGLPEAVRPLAGELVMDLSSCAGIAEAILTSISGERKLPSSAACSEYVKTRFSWSSIARKTKSVYEEILT